MPREFIDTNGNTNAFAKASQEYMEGIRESQTPTSVDITKASLERAYEKTNKSRASDSPSGTN